MTTITATYSVEDNKLRLYVSSRLDEATYQRVKEAGFKWAPKQELFVAPRWTPAREDLCVELAGEITAEQTTLIERAEAKAERLDNLARKRAKQANAFHRAADRIAERFVGGQPILVGHHSERRARRDQDRMHRAMDAAVAATKAVDYWNYRSAGVEHHVNRKADPRVKARRIKKLLAELRDWQRDINHAYICLELWETIQAETNSEKFKQAVEHYAGARLKTGDAAPWLQGKSYWQLLRDGSISPAEVVDNCLSFHERQAHSPYKARWINHLLNRLAWERSELGEVDRFTGTLTASILQAFAREHGAHQPKAKKDGDQWRLTSSVPLPLHLGDGKELLLNAGDWCELMQASGYAVPAPKPKQPPILNFAAAYIKGHRCGSVETFRQIKLTKAEYSAIYNDYRGVKLSACGQFRFKVCKNPEQRGWDAEWCAVLLTDSKQHEPLESAAIIQVGQEVA